MKKIVALAGGVGGAKLAEGLYRILPPEDLTIVVNTGDDFTYYGLKISPDLDTVCYTLAGVANRDTGWGRADETFDALETLGQLGGETWFRLGDKDLGLHLQRSERLKAGVSLSKVTGELCAAWGVEAKVLPMSDDEIPTLVGTKEAGVLPFQEYFVREQCRPTVTDFEFKGAAQAKPAPGLIESLSEADGVIICPSNPWVSIGPILAVPGIRECLVEKTVVAVSPLVLGQAVKGPAAKMYRELGWDPTAVSVAKQYKDFLNGMVIDFMDANLQPAISNLGIVPYPCKTIMGGLVDRMALAREVLSFLENLVRRKY